VRNRCRFPGGIPTHPTSVSQSNETLWITLIFRVMDDLDFDGEVF